MRTLVMRTGLLIALAIFLIGTAVASAALLGGRWSLEPAPGPQASSGATPDLLIPPEDPLWLVGDSTAFRDAQGGSVSLRDFRGKVVVLNFWATWCPPCVREMPSLDRLQAELGGPAFEVVAVSTDRGAMDGLRAFYDQHGIEHLALYQDPGMAFARAVGVKGLPTTYILDHDGTVLGTHTGYADWQYPDLVAWFKTRIAAVPGMALR